MAMLDYRNYLLGGFCFLLVISLRSSGIRHHFVGEDVNAKSQPCP